MSVVFNRDLLTNHCLSGFALNWRNGTRTRTQLMTPSVPASQASFLAPEETSEYPSDELLAEIDDVERRSSTLGGGEQKEARDADSRRQCTAPTRIVDQENDGHWTRELN